MSESVTVDCRGMQCPAPILHLAKTARQAAGKPVLLEVMADDTDFPMDLEAWCRTTRASLHAMTSEAGVHRAIIGLNGAALPAAPPASPSPPASAARIKGATSGPYVVDLRGHRAPAPILHLSQLAAQHPGAHLIVHADDPSFIADAMPFASAIRATVISASQAAGASLVELVLPGGEAAPEPEVPVQTALAVVAAAPEPTAIVKADTDRENRSAILVLHNDFEALMAALMVANASAAQGMEVVVFFSFWGVNLLRGERPRKDLPRGRVSILQRLMKWMMPKGPRRQKMSKMHMGGMGKGLMVRFMRRNNVMELSQLIDTAVEQKVRFVVCSMSMGIMGIERRDIMDLPNVEFAGVTSFVEEARRAGTSLVF